MCVMNVSEQIKEPDNENVPSNELKVTIEDNGCVVVFYLDGPFNLRTANKLKDAWDRIDKNKLKVVGLDLKHVERMDSSAIGLIVLILNQVMGKKAKLIILDAEYYIRKLFHIMKFQEYIEIMTTKGFENYIHKEGYNQNLL